MNQPTREEHEELKERVRRLEQQQTEPIKVTIEQRQTDIEQTLDKHVEILKELSVQSDRHTQAFIQITQILNKHTESISALQADVISIKATQSDHGETLRDHGQRLNRIEETMATKDDVGRLEKVMLQILNRLPRSE